MLRSTSVKNDIWKPVKLLARQSVEGPILHSSCNFRGDVVAVLTASNFSIFNNRELLYSISLDGGKKVHVTEDSSSIFVLTGEKLYCYNAWGEIKWEYDEIDNQTFISISKSGNNIALSKGNNLQVLNRFGDLKSNISFDSEILSYARKRLNTMNIILSIDAVNDLPTNTLNIESLQNIIANLNLTINDVDYDEQLLYENKLAIMQTHQEFLVFSSNLDNPLNTINDVLTNVNVNNILQKRIELDSLGNKSVIEEYVSLFNTKDILNKLSILNIEKEKIILSFSEKIINIINDDSYNTLGNGKLKQSIFLLKELDASAFNMGLHSNQNITGVNFTPIQLYNNLKNTIDDRVVVIINDINDKIINSNENIDLHKLISILVNLDNENIELFDSDIYSNLLSRYNVAINHVRASVDLLIDEWEELKINPELWEKQEYCNKLCQIKSGR